MKEKTFMKKYGMLLMILGVAAVTRLAGLGKIPEGILPDEACAAYTAWALMTVQLLYVIYDARVKRSKPT